MNRISDHLRQPPYFLRVTLLTYKLK